MKKKLIHSIQTIFLKCDNQNCSYLLKEQSTSRTYESYLNEPCPNCQSNLLTKADYLRHLKVIKIENWLNKWFGWLGSYPDDAANKSIGKIDVHKKITFEPTKPD